MGAVSFSVRGAYFESCNCEAICPCRMVNGVKGGRSTYGICYGALSWRVDDGIVGGVDVTGLCAALVVRYDDDEPGSPWSIVLHVDDRGSVEQREALADVLLIRASSGQPSASHWIAPQPLSPMRSDTIVALEIPPDFPSSR